MMKIGRTLITVAYCAALCILEADSVPIPKTEVIRYLEDFGYLRSTNGEVISEEMISKAISSFQSFAGINVTGVMDVETTEWMRKPRCGNEDRMYNDDDIEDILLIPENLHAKKEKNQEELEICKDPHIDTIFYHPEDDSIYVFKGKQYWRLTQKGKVADGYPKLIATKWKGLPNDIDAAFPYYGKTYFIKGSEYWTYNGDDVDPGCPRRFSDFPGVPADIDTAWVRNDYVNVYGYVIYIFKGKDVWVIADPVRHPRLDIDFEMKLRSIKGFPGNLDAALTYDGKTYFFKGDDYYLIEGKKLKVSKGYPKKTSIDWFGCPVPT